MSRMTVAVIDHDRRTAFGLSLLLSDWGYEAVNGQTAPELYGLTEILGRRIAAIVADDRLSDGTAGHFEAAALSRLAGRPIPTIVLAGAEPDSAAELEAQGYLVLAKPAEPVRLRSLLGAILARSE